MSTMGNRRPTILALWAFINALTCNGTMLQRTLVSILVCMSQTKVHQGLKTVNCKMTLEIGHECMCSLLIIWSKPTCQIGSCICHVPRLAGKPVVHSGRGPYLRGCCSGEDVKVLGLAANEQVSYRATHNIAFVACTPQDASHFCNYLLMLILNRVLLECAVMLQAAILISECLVSMISLMKSPAALSFSSTVHAGLGMSALLIGCASSSQIFVSIMGNRMLSKGGGATSALASA